MIYYGKATKCDVIKQLLGEPRETLSLKLSFKRHCSIFKCNINRLKEHLFRVSPSPVKSKLFAVSFLRLDRKHHTYAKLWCLLTSTKAAGKDCCWL